jgi:hypothetical protein
LTSEEVSFGEKKRKDEVNVKSDDEGKKEGRIRFVRKPSNYAPVGV